MSPPVQCDYYSVLHLDKCLTSTREGSDTTHNFSFTGETEETDGLRLQEQVERLEMEVRRLKEELEKCQRDNRDVTADNEPQSPGYQFVQRCLLWCGNNRRN